MRGIEESGTRPDGQTDTKKQPSPPKVPEMAPPQGTTPVTEAVPPPPSDSLDKFVVEFDVEALESLTEFEDPKLMDNYKKRDKGHKSYTSSSMVAKGGRPKTRRRRRRGSRRWKRS
ncbi:hypothetical protein AAHA92_12137 [Salvia divinorum]|uniref:Uncharacterized protein n=1 Tax=Salvia divinorum TaxID=28513 RepID=A0ABD1HNE5_SALDI